MALDTGGVTQLHLYPDMDGSPSVATSKPTLDFGPHVGAALKAVREHRGQTVEELADVTRVRRAYLSAIEDMRLDALPSRPFAIGYVRAYAKALGLDGEAAVDRFKLDSPDPDEVLRAPVGVSSGPDPRLGLIVVVGAVILGCIVLWNVARRAMADDAPPPPAIAEAPAAAAAPGAGSVALGAPLPAPVESTTPVPYVTPGLADAAANGGSADAALAASKARAAAGEVAATDTVVLGAPFEAKGAVMGAVPEESVVTLQARKSASLILRGPDGQVHFARQMAAGEAYRAPAIKGLVADVSDPKAFEVFVAGVSKGLMPAAQTAVGKLAD